MCWNQAALNPFLALHPEMRKERWWQSHITKSYYLSATVAHFVVKAILFLNLAFECMCACLCGGINKIQQISRWATSEIIMVIAPQKRYFPQDSRVASTSFPSNIALLLSPGWEQSSSSPWRRCFLPLCWCFNNLHSNVISKLASIVSSGLLCAMKLDSILGKSPVVWEPEPAKVTCWEKNKETEITVALQPWMPYQLGNNREAGKKTEDTVCLTRSWGRNYMHALF